MCGRLLAPLSGITLTTRAHSAQQLQNGMTATSVQPLASIQKANCAASSCFVSSPPRSAVSSQVPACPTRNSQVMQCRLLRRSRNSHSLSSYSAAASRLFLTSRLSYQFPFHPWTLLCRRFHHVTPFRMCPRRRLIRRSPRYLLTWQYKRLSTASSSYLWMPLCRRSHTVLPLRTYLRRWVLVQPPRYLLTRLCRHLYAVLYYTILPHNYRSRSSLLDVSSRMIPLIVRARHRHKAILVVPHRLNLLTWLRLAVSAVPVLTETVTCTLRPHVSCCSHHRVSNGMPRLQVSIRMPTCAPHMVYLSKRHRCDPICVQLSQSRSHSLLSVPSMWEHIMHVQLLLVREVLVPLWREPTILLLQILVQGLFLFLNRVPSFFLLSTLVNPNLKGTVVLIQLTVISYIIKSVFPFFNGIQAGAQKSY